MSARTSESFVRGMFKGEIDIDRLPPVRPLSQDRQDTLDMILESVRKFLGKHQGSFREFDVQGAQPDAYISEIASLGLFGLIIPEEFGGFQCSSREYARVLEELSRADGSTALTVGAHSSIGMKGVVLFGSPEQKARYLPKLATGELKAAFCLTEAGAGSDAAAISTRATQQADGSWILEGEKIWITNGGFADLFTVFAKTGEDQITAFIVERAFAGVSSGPKEDKMGIRASLTTSVRFDQVGVPAENVLGEVGNGFKVAMTILNNGRTGLGGGCIGSMKRCLELASAQAANRKQFGRSIGSFQLIQDKLARMAAWCFATETLVERVAALIDGGSADYSLEAAISKIVASESLWFVADEALQIAGGNGFMREFPYERIVRDARINRIFEGTNEILRLYVGLTGIREAGDYLRGVSKGIESLLSDPSGSLGTLTDYASKRIIAYVPGVLDGGRISHGDYADHFSLLAKYTAAFAQGVETVVRRYKKDVVEQQLSVRRVADCAIDLYTGWVVLVRANAMLDYSEDDAGSVRSMVTIILHEVKRRIAHNLRRLTRNEDEHALALGRRVLEAGGYPW
jgi:acyl-CoA dehydrogenase family protein 9